MVKEGLADGADEDLWPSLFCEPGVGLRSQGLDLGLSRLGMAFILVHV